MTKSNETKLKIEQASIRLFADKGFDGTSIKDIAKLVGISDAALYRHYASKEEMGTQIYRKYYSEMAALIITATPETLHAKRSIREIIHIFCKCFYSNPSLFRFLLLSQHRFLTNIPEGKENVVDVIIRVVKKGIKRKEIGFKEADQATAIIMGIVLQTAVFCLYGRLTKDIRIIEDSLMNTISRALEIRG